MTTDSEARPATIAGANIRSEWGWAWVIAGAALILYAPSLAFGWVYDDQMEVVLNPLVQSWRYLPDIFTSTAWAGSGMETYLYRPLVGVSYLINHSVSGLSPWSYHLFNVLLHAACSILVFRIGQLWGFTLTVAGTGGLLFAIHPVHVEAVSAVFGRKDLLAAFFTLTMLLSHRKGMERGGWHAVVTVGAWAGALLSKEVGMVALALVAVQDGFLEPHPKAVFRKRRAPVLYSAYLAVFLGYVLLRTQVAGGMGIPDTSPLDNPLVAAGFVSRISTALVVVAKGFSLLALPLVLSPDYSFDAIPLVDSALDPRVWGTALLLASLGYGLWRLEGKGRSLGLLGGWYALAILPTSNLLVTVGTVFGERLLYLPSVAVCLLAAVGTWGLHSRWPRAVPVVIVGLCIAWTGQTLRYSQSWKDDLSLFRWAVSAVPNSTKAHHKLGEEQLRAGSLGDAVRSLKRSLAIAPHNRFAAVTLSQAVAAIEDRFLPLRSSLPGDPDVLYVLGQAVRRGGKPADAEVLWKETLAANPEHAEALADLGALRIVDGDTLSGLEHLEEAVRIRPEMAWPWVNLARVYLAQGDGLRARVALERFLEINDPRMPAEILWARGALGTLPSR